MSAGIVLNKKVGDKVTKGELLCTLHTNKDEKTYQAIIEDVKKAFKFSKDLVAVQPVIREIIEN